MKKAIALLAAGLLLALGACAPADATPVALDDECVTKDEAMSAIHDWDPKATEYALRADETEKYLAWHDSPLGHGLSHGDGDLWAVSVTWSDGQGFIIANVGEDGCIVTDSVGKVKQKQWDEIMSGVPL